MGGGGMGGGRGEGRGAMDIPPRPDVSFARGESKRVKIPKRPEMRGPSGDVNSLLAGLKTKNINIKKDSSSTVSVSEVKEMKRDLEMPKKSRRKKSERNTISLNL
jgi:hypothetical protein